ncbi:MAG: cache domain-containing protein [Campylobacterota bacterium]|nr:cache domain-containing protein [Campylobacterota bacterium]
MNKLILNKSINKINFFSLLFAAVLLVFFLLLVFYNSYTQYKSDISKIEYEYIKSQKKFIEQETKRALRFISYKHKNNKSKSIDELQKEIVDAIEHMRNSLDGTGYIFIYTFDGVNIADPILKENAGKNLIDFTDPNGKKVIYDLIDVSKNDNGGYVKYVWNKPTTNTLEEKISYAISYKPWKWMIGTGVYLDNIQIVLDKKKQTYYNKISSYLVQVVSIMIVMFIIGVIVYRYLMSILQDDIRLIRESSEKLKNIDTKKISFKEFKQVALHINTMKDNLNDLNKNLEKKVHQRTKELEKSERYVNELVVKQDRFVKDAIHEINTPLSIIITNIDLFKLKLPANKYLSKIEAASKIIHNIYNDLEYMVKKDRIEYPKENISLDLFILNRIEFFNEIAIANNLNFKSKIENNINILFNTILLQRICDNTLSNAIKYSYKESIIDINLYKKHRDVYLDIINNGDTIDDTDKLFERYYRENSSRGGFGIGLNIIKEICIENKIKLEVHSIDNLTTFRYIFTNNKKDKEKYENTTA